MKPRHVHRSEDCRAVSDILQRIGDKWTILVVGKLGQGAMRFSELRLAVGGISQKMLTTTLRGLERDGFVLPGEDGRIAAVLGGREAARALAEASVVIGGAGMLVLPGAVDAHVHAFSEPAETFTAAVTRPFRSRTGAARERSPRASSWSTTA